MAWFLLSIAIVAEIAGTLMLKASDGLSKLWPSLGVAVGYAIAFSLMAISLKKLEVGITYAVWSGVGIMGAAIGGVIFFDQHLSKLNIIGMAIIIVGVVVMNLGGAAH
jgi:small multidrug resistance pump